MRNKGIKNLKKKKEKKRRKKKKEESVVLKAGPFYDEYQRTEITFKP